MTTEFSQEETDPLSTCPVNVSTSFATNPFTAHRTQPAANPNVFFGNSRMGADGITQQVGAVDTTQDKMEDTVQSNMTGLFQGN